MNHNNVYFRKWTSIKSVEWHHRCCRGTDKRTDNLRW